MKLLLLLILLTAISASAQTFTDPVETKFQSDLKRLQSDYDQKLKEIHTRMLAEYDREIAASSRDPERVIQLKARQDALRDKIDQGTRIAGQWNIKHGPDTTAVWKINRDRTYNYWNEEGRWEFKDGKYYFFHTWDWEIRLLDDDTFEGVCIRGSDDTITGKRE